MTKTLISGCDRAESGLYTVHGEDRLLYVYDTSIVARTADGRRFAHKTYLVKGWVEGPYGKCPNYDAKRRTTEFANKVADRGWIDTAHWDLLPEHDGLQALKDSWGVEADHEQAERRGGAGW